MKVFYSWQSDLPNNTNRGFIEKALENAARVIRADDSIQVEPVIDRDTAGVPGAPDIAGTILEKIEQAQVFVCDVSIINQSQEFRPTPNPNVLIELGYAMKALGAHRIVMVLNTAFGSLDLLPFDLRMKRVIAYHMPIENQERATERKKLEAVLEQGLRSIIAGIAAQPSTPISPPISEQAITAIENAIPNQALLVRRFMAYLVGRLDELNPKYSEGDIIDEKLVETLERTHELVIEFARVAESIATINAHESALMLYKSFAPMLERYKVKRGFSESHTEVDFDFYKFLGHELFVTFFSFLIQENRWELITGLLDEDIYIENAEDWQPGSVSFAYVSQRVELLDIRKQRLKSNQMSLHADILKERHRMGDLGTFVPIYRFASADFFLFLRGELQKDESDGLIDWSPWSILYLRQPPQFLQEAVRRKYAERLIQPLGVDSVETLRTRLPERTAILSDMFRPGGFWRNPMRHFDSQSIGSR